MNNEGFLGTKKIVFWDKHFNVALLLLIRIGDLVDWDYCQDIVVS